MVHHVASNELETIKVVYMFYSPTTTKLEAIARYDSTFFDK